MARIDSRRRFVRNMGVGGVVALGSAAVPATLLGSPALAQGGTGGEQEAIPQEDLLRLGFAETIEWALVELYRAAIDTRILEGERPDGPAQLQALRTFEEHHREHGALLRLAIDENAEEGEQGEPNASVTSQYLPRIEGAADGQQLLGVMYELEERTAATYQAILGELQSVGAAQPAASILPIEGQHAVAWGADLDRPIGDYLPSYQIDTQAFPIDLSIVTLPTDETSPTGTAVTGTSVTGATTGG